MSQIRRKSPMMMMLDLRICDTRWFRTVITALVVFNSLSVVLCSHSARFSAPLNLSESDDGFKPIILSHFDPEYIARNLFTETGQYRIFSPVDSDLRMNFHRLTGRDVIEEETVLVASTASPKASEEVEVDTKIVDTTEADTTVVDTNEVVRQVADTIEVDTTEVNNVQDNYLDNALRSELKCLENLLVSYLGELFTRKQVKKPDITVEINEEKDAVSDESDANEGNLERSLKRFARSAVVSVALPKAVETGRLFFFSGLKKILWPIFVGIQVIKSILFALFLPSIIGSLGKIAGQGSASIAGFNRPSETVSDLNFKDNFEDDSKYMLMNGGYAYNQPEASTNHFSTQLYDAAAINNNALSRFGMTDQRDTYVNSLGYDTYKKSNTNVDTSLSEGYQAFKKVPSSSLLLSNFDPFYSPLLSRLDSVFQQLGLKTNDENCREKLICSMYADPAKYAPYSNLVSAQLSRELDELRKPTSENPEILRFFKYMKAAKDGQDGVQCEVTYSVCTEFKDFEDPAMITTYHDINKLVEARKLV